MHRRIPHQNSLRGITAGILGVQPPTTSPWSKQLAQRVLDEPSGHSFSGKPRTNLGPCCGWRQIAEVFHDGFHLGVHATQLTASGTGRRVTDANAYPLEIVL